jgi:hypothetical protein
MGVKVHSQNGVEGFKLTSLVTLFEPPVEARTSFYVGILAQKATWLGRLLDPGW